MAEDGRPSERGHCLKALPFALLLFVMHVLMHPGRLVEAWKETR